MLQYFFKQEYKIKITDLILNQDRLNLIRTQNNGDFENKIERVLQDILDNSDTELPSMIKLFHLIDSSTNQDSDLLDNYSIGERIIEVINTSEQLSDAIRLLEVYPFVGFDSEQKPTFKKGQPSFGISLIQLATRSKCYLIHIKQIKDLKPLMKILGDDKIIKIGTGLKGDNQALFNQFKLRLQSIIDLENIFKKLSSKNQMGAKRAASLILNLNLQKSQSMSRSNWENKELSNAQIKYASEDATVVFDVMEKMLQQYPFVLNIMPSFFQKLYIK